MTTLQAQSDAAFQDADQAVDIHAQRAAEDSGVGNLGFQNISFASDDGDDVPPPDALQYDGKGHQRPVTEIEFADEDAGAVSPAEAPQQAQRTDLHQPDDHSGNGDWDPELLARAKMYGLDDQAVKGQYDSPDKLEKALLSIDQQAISQYEALQRQQAYQSQIRYAVQQELQGLGQAQTPMQVPPTAEQLQAQYEAYKLSNPDVYDEVLANDLSGLANHTVSQLQQQHQEMEQLRSLVEQQQASIQQFQSRQQQEAIFREQLDFDAAIQSLGEGWADTLGTEKAQEMDVNSPEIVNRRKVYETARLAQQAYAAQGKYRSLRDVLPSSLQISFPDKQAVAPPASAPPARRDSKGKFLARPTRHNRGAQVDNREQALRKWDSFFARSGLPGEYGTEGGLADI